MNMVSLQCECKDEQLNVQVVKMLYHMCHMSTASLEWECEYEQLTLKMLYHMCHVNMTSFQCECEGD